MDARFLPGHRDIRRDGAVISGPHSGVSDGKLIET